jgi:hypothetical protein
LMTWCQGRCSWICWWIKSFWCMKEGHCCWGSIWIIPCRQLYCGWKIESEEVALECIDVNEFIDPTTPDGTWNDWIFGGWFLYK